MQSRRDFFKTMADAAAGTFVEVSLLLILIAGMASVIPALRAARVNPAEAMRQN